MGDPFPFREIYPFGSAPISHRPQFGRQVRQRVAPRSRQLGTICMSRINLPDMSLLTFLAALLCHPWLLALRSPLLLACSSVHNSFSLSFHSLLTSGKVLPIHGLIF